MRKLILAAAMCAAVFSAKALSYSVNATNHTTKTVYFYVYGIRAANYTGHECGSATGPTLYILPPGPGTTVTVNNTSLSGFGPTDYITNAQCLDMDPTCGPVNTYMVGSACSFWSTTATYPIFRPTPSCLPNGSVTAVWTPGALPATPAQLDFY